MRYELKHDKLAAQIYNLASTEAKARRKAENIYHMYDEIGATRLFTQEELEYLAQFQAVLRPKEHLIALIGKSKEELNRARREAEERERARLEREKELVKKIKGRQRRISWVIGIAGVAAAALLVLVFLQLRKVSQYEAEAKEIKRNLEKKMQLTDGLKSELSAVIMEKQQNEPLAVVNYVTQLNETLPSVLIDARDGTIYETVELNEQYWMAENLNYAAAHGSWVYGEDPENEEKYGRLYTWEAARRACPKGWRLPTDQDWRKMAGDYSKVDIASQQEPGSAYAALIKGGDSNFDALHGGTRRPTGTFVYLGEIGQYWSGTQDSGNKAFLFQFVETSGKLQRNSYEVGWGASCRCVKNIGD